MSGLYKQCSTDNIHVLIVQYGLRVEIKESQKKGGGQQQEKKETRKKKRIEGKEETMYGTVNEKERKTRGRRTGRVIKKRRTTGGKKEEAQKQIRSNLIPWSKWTKAANHNSINIILLTMPPACFQSCHLEPL